MMGITADLEKRFIDTLGLNTASVGRTAIERVVRTAVKRSGVTDVSAYLELLSTAPEEFERCLEDLVVPETWFFRDTEPFLLLKQHLCEKWFPSHRNETVRILSAPCSTGEEPYSIAMTLLEAGIQSRQFHLDAVDISRKALATADRAVYGKGAFRQPLTAAQGKFFSGPPGERRMAETIVRTVNFFRKNLVDHDFLAGQEPYHIIFCRNILIYLTDEARRQVIDTMCRLLAPDGILFTGHAEMGLLQQQGFTAVRHARSFACRRTAPPASLPGDKFQISPFSHPETFTDRDCPAVLSGFSPPAETSSTAPPQEMVSPISRAAAVAVGVLHAEALSLADRGQFDEAAALCRRYLREQHPHADVYCLLALTHEAARRYGEARECYEKALYLNPNHHETLIHLSLLCRQQGDGRQASLYLQRAGATGRRLDGTVAP